MEQGWVFTSLIDWASETGPPVVGAGWTGGLLVASVRGLVPSTGSVPEQIWSTDALSVWSLDWSAKGLSLSTGLVCPAALSLSVGSELSVLMALMSSVLT